MFDILKKQNTVENIPVELIIPNRFQPRRIFDDAELLTLAESIRENGLIQPISVRKIKGGFELIAGERRLRACKLIGRQKIEAIVYDIGDKDSAVWALIENLQRSDLGPFDEAEAIAKLIAAWSVPREEAAKRLGLAPSTLSNKLRLLKLEPEVRRIVTDNSLTERHARELLRIESSKGREEAAKHIAAKSLNVSETERYIDKLLENEKPKPKAAKYIVKDLRLFINTFEHAVEVMNSAGLCAVSTVTESEEKITYSVSIPKSKAFRTSAKPADDSAAPVRSASAPSVI
ncbi:MAG: ParB/RepB/Spo0J family partition protein [Oscillospiraceae bacterium]|nr:ParB/RepB/Spo0J family partition protein [Oscillospiraceae bacterium]